jgi:hypothetical protein
LGRFDVPDYHTGWGQDEIAALEEVGEHHMVKPVNPALNAFSLPVRATS